MPTFTNYATLTYSGGTTNSNTVTGELLQPLTMTKNAVSANYAPGGIVTYSVSLVNNGATALTGLTLTDDLGAYSPSAGTTLYPLEYNPDSATLYVDGVLQPPPTVVPGPPMQIRDLLIPAGANAMLIYETRVTGQAPMATGSFIENNVVSSGAGLVEPVRATARIAVQSRPNLTIFKSVDPVNVPENSALTYTFTIENTGNVPAEAIDNVALTDNLNPVLTGLTATYNGTPWTAGTHYTYDEATGAFASVPGQITVPAATYTRAADGTYITTPGVATVTITGTV